MDAEGEVLTSSMDRSVAGFQKTATALGEVAELDKAEKAGKLHGDAAARLILAKIDLGKLDFAAAQPSVASLSGVSPEFKKKLDARLLDLEIGGIFSKHQTAAMPEQQKLMQAMRPAGGAQPSKEERDAAQAAMTELTNSTQDAIAADLLALVEKGAVPADKTAARFWQTLMRHAERHKNDAMSKRAKGEMEALAKRDPEQKDMIERMLNPGAARPAARIQKPEEKPPTGDGAKAKGKASGDGN